MRLAARVTKTCLKLAALTAFALLTRGVPARAGALTQHSAPLASTPVLAATASTRPVATLAAVKCYTEHLDALYARIRTNAESYLVAMMCDKKGEVDFNSLQRIV